MVTFKDILLFLVTCSIALLPSCSSKVAGTSATAAKGYSEDLSALRALPPLPPDTSKTSTTTGAAIKRDPAVYVEARQSINNTLDAVLDSISEFNLQNGVVDGFTIQVYSGPKREEALNVKKQIATTLPELESDVQYVQPNFRVRTGKYYNRLEAQKDYLSVKRYFPNAIVIPDRIFFRN